MEQRVSKLEFKFDHLERTTEEKFAEVLSELKEVKKLTENNSRLLSSWKGGLAVLGVVGTILALFISWGLDVLK